MKASISTRFSFIIAYLLGFIVSRVARTTQEYALSHFENDSLDTPIGLPGWVFPGGIRYGKLSHLHTTGANAIHGRQP